MTALRSLGLTAKQMPKTFRHLWLQIASFDGLHAAYIKARRNKRYDRDTLLFSMHLEDELLKLLDELEGGHYRTGVYHRFAVYEPKKREVAALPFRDRVVQHALCNAIEPIYERRFAHDSYACRVGKGTHAGVDRLTEFLREAHRTYSQTFILKADVSKFFPSVDHVRLKQIMRQHVACSRTLTLIDGIIDSWNANTGKGIPIGNLTSQLFANIYLNELDQFVKQELHWRMYVRYMDDVVLVGDNKADLQQVQQRIGEFLYERLRLALNPKTAIFPEDQGVGFLGYRVWRTHRLLRQTSIRKMRRKLRAFMLRYCEGAITQEKIQQSVASWIGHAKHAETYTLRKCVFGQFILRR